MTLSERAKELGISSRELAEATNCNINTLNQYRSGIRRIPPQKAKQFASALKVTLEEFWDMAYKNPLDNPE